MNGPSITVVIPLHQGAEFIEDTLDSLAAQSSPVDEIIVVDDGSTDGGPDRVAAHPVEATVVFQPHLGVATSRNHGAYLARSEWIAFMDQDDLWHPQRLAGIRRQVVAGPELQGVATRELGFALERDREALRGHPRATMVKIWAEAGSSTEIARRLAAEGPVSGGVSLITLDDVLANVQFVTTSCCFSREAFFRAGGCAPWARSADDYVLLADVARLGPIACLGEQMTFYRVHPSSVSHGDELADPFLSTVVALEYGGIMRTPGPASASGPRPALRDRPLAFGLLSSKASSARSWGQVRSALAFLLLLGRDGRDTRLILGRVVRQTFRTARRRLGRAG